MRKLLEKIIDACKDENTTFHIPGELYCKALEILAETEPEPVAWMHQVSKAVVSNSRKIPGITLDDFTIPLYTTPPSQQAPVRLSDEKMASILVDNLNKESISMHDYNCAKSVEQAVLKANGLGGEE